MRQALVLAAVLAAAAIAIAAALGLASLLLLKAFLALQLLYSLVLKRIPFVDVLAIAGLFVIRAAAGAVADRRPDLDVAARLHGAARALPRPRQAAQPSSCSWEAPGAGPRSARLVLPRHARPRARCLRVVATGVYAVYTFNAPLVADAGDDPFVVFGVFRYLMLVRRRELGEEPEEILLSDRPLLCAVAGWAVVAAIVLLTTVERWLLPPGEPGDPQQIEQHAGELRISRTRVSGWLAQRTGISAISRPSRRASTKSSASNAKPSMRCCAKTSRARDRRKSLKPHCVSR